LKKINKNQLLLITGAICFSSLLLIPFPVGPNRFFWQEFFDAGHVVLFFFLTIALFKVIRLKRETKKNKIIIIALTTFSISVFLEALQPLFERSWSLEDLFLGILGIFSAFVFLNNILLGMILFIIFQIFGALPAIYAAQAIIWRNKNTPLIAEFETDTEMPMWKGIISRDKSIYNSGAFSLKVEGDEYSQAKYTAGFQNWNNFKALHFSVFNPNDFVAKISIRIDDNEDCSEFSQRYNQSFSINKGWNPIKIPIGNIKKTPSGRELNTSKISRIYFFSYGKSKMKTFYLDSIKLEH